MQYLYAPEDPVGYVSIFQFGNCWVVEQFTPDMQARQIIVGIDNSNDLWATLIRCGVLRPEQPKHDKWDIVHFDLDGWYFWYENWADRDGPYPTAEIAHAAMKHYCATVLNCLDEEWVNFINGKSIINA